jgi:multicomponent Na+:H+ antiporter subunit B
LRWLVIAVLCLFFAVLLYAEGDLPEYGDTGAPANLHVSPYYIQRSLEETDTPNMVTAVLADYRSYDTLGETVVIFTAGIACVLLLMRRKSGED